MAAALSLSPFLQIVCGKYCILIPFRRSSRALRMSLSVPQYTLPFATDRTANRPDLQFAICMCARYQARPTEKHVHAVKRIFRYLRGTVHRGLWYPKDSSVALTAFADLDHAGYQDTHRICTDSFLNKTMATIIEQQVALDEALVPSTQRLRIERSNFRLPSVIQSKESTLQLATAYVHQRSIRFKMNNKKHIVELESFREMLHICPRIPGQAFAELPFEEEILEFIRFLGHGAPIRTLTDININKLYQPNTKAYKEYYVCATTEAAPKPKASAKRKRSGSDTSITPPTATTTPITTVAVTLRLTATAKGKQPAKAKSPSDPSEVARTEAQQLKIVLRKSRQQTHISQLGGSGTDEGTGSKPGVSDVPFDDSEDEYDGEETREEESFDPIPRTLKDSKDDGNGEEDQGLSINEEERLNEEEEAEELYRDVNINQGRGIQATLNVEDSHVTLTLVHPGGQQESSSVSSQFVTSMLNPPSDAVGFNSLVHSLRALSALRRSGLRTASTAATPCQGDSSKFYLLTGSIHIDQRGTVVLATLFNGSEQRYFRSFITNINLQESRRDGTLNDVRNALDDRLKGIRMQYLPQTIWRKGDKDRAAAMIQAIDKMLKIRRIMRSLERFVEGILYEGDFRMLQRTI
nr:retrovirus-related Pol polyprotein from transposon TNT 1-94 [Tanacetum cinerariifolium]